MDIVYQYIERIASTIVFILACYVLAGFTKNCFTLLRESRLQLQQPAVNEQLYEIEEDIVSSSELKAALFYELEFDVQIDDILISKQEHTVQMIESYQNKSIRYKRSYAYDSRGNITRVIYISLESV